MDKIELKQVLPLVFEERRSLMQSDVWLQNLTFQKGHLYLVEIKDGKVIAQINMKNNTDQYMPAMTDLNYGHGIPNLVPVDRRGQTDYLEAVVDGKIQMGYTYPYTSATGLNFLVNSLQYFDSSDMLSADNDNRLVPLRCCLDNLFY